MSSFDRPPREPGAHGVCHHRPDHGSYTVTESLALPPDEGVHHDSNPIQHAALSDVPLDNEADARKGSGRPQVALRGLRSTRSNEIA